MRAACKSGETRRRETRSDAAPRSFTGQFRASRRSAGEGRFTPHPQSTDRGPFPRPADRSAPLDQCDIDRKLAIVGEKLSRAVERIDQQEPLRNLRVPSGGHRFLSAYRNLRNYARETFADDGFRPMIRRRYRTAVRFRCDRAASLIFLHHRGPGRQCDLRKKQGDLVAARAIERSRIRIPQNRTQVVILISVTRPSEATELAQARLHRKW